MNYIAEIRAFYDWMPFNSISADAQALWHALMHLNNKCAVRVKGEWLWRVEFTVSNTTLVSYLGFSRTQLDRMRNVLIQSGRIRYRKGKGNQCGTYQMIPFDTHYVTQPVTQTDTQTGAQVVTQMWRTLGPLDNSNTTSTSTRNSNFSHDDGEAETGAAERNVVAEYLAGRDLDMDTYLGMSGEVRTQAEQLAQAIFDKFSARQPTRQDVMLVFQRVHKSEEQSGEWRITFPKNRIDLLLYAFQTAAERGEPGNWPYITEVLARLKQRGIETLEQAEDYDDTRR